MSSKLKATICIPVYNGEKYLAQIFESLHSQKLKDPFEVLVIDSGSTDGSLEIINNAQKKYKNIRLQEIPNKEFGHGKTRNLAAQMAKGEFIVYITHDAIPAHDYWLYEIIKPFELNQGIVGVLGKQDPRPQCVPLLKYEIQSVFSNLGNDCGTTLYYKDSFMKEQGIKDLAYFYSDVNAATRRVFILNEIPYRDVPYSEDQMFGRDIVEAGYIKAYAGRANVVHSNDITLGEYKHRMFDETLGLRKIGVEMTKPKRIAMVKLIASGVLRDTVNIIRDPDYSLKRKLYWTALNPLYHIEKWRGVALGTKARLDDKGAYKKYSLEHLKKR